MNMSKFKAFLERKDIKISLRRYGIDAVGAMAQGLFCSLLIGTIINTIGTQFNIPFLTTPIATVAGVEYTLGGIATAMSGPAMAVAIGYALNTPPLVLFSMISVGFAANALGGAGGPLAVLFVAIIAAECGKAISRETKVDILVTPLVTICVGILLSWLIAPPLGRAAMWLGDLIKWATELQPLLMGIVVSVLVGMALTLPISSAAICAALGLTGLAGGAAVAGCCAQMVGFAVLSFRENRWGGILSQGLGTSMLQMPNIINCLPAPPDTASEMFKHDINRFFWGKEQRLNPERAAMARRDAVWGYDHVTSAYKEEAAVSAGRIYQRARELFGKGSRISDADPLSRDRSEAEIDAALRKILR